VRDINFRIGTLESGGITAFRKHPWFSSINWRVLEAKKSTPPFVPDSKNSNFDATHELVELFIEDKPLRSKSVPKKSKSKSNQQNNSSLSSNAQQGAMSVNDMNRDAMKEKYLVYDFSKPIGYRSFHSGYMPEMSLPVDYPSTETLNSTLTKTMSNPALHPDVVRLTPSKHTVSQFADIMEGRDSEVSLVGLDSVITKAGSD